MHRIKLVILTASFLVFLTQESLYGGSSYDFFNWYCTNLLKNLTVRGLMTIVSIRDRLCLWIYIIT